jgi:REP element-mobilizing transposase RayT
MRPKRIAGFDCRGTYPYSLTFCTFHRRPYFEDVAKVSIVLREILRSAIEYRFDILAYCFMPDHLHLLVQSSAPDSELLGFVRLFRQRTTLAVRGRDVHCFGNADTTNEHCGRTNGWRSSPDISKVIPFAPVWFAR